MMVTTETEQGQVMRALAAGADEYVMKPFTRDILVAKLVVYGTSREECLMRLRRALEEYVIGGIETTIPLHQRLVENADFRSGAYDIHWLERFLRKAG